MTNLTQEDQIDFKIAVAKEEIHDNTPIDFHTALSAALPVLKWTDRQMQLMLNMSIAPLTLAVFLLVNRSVKKGYIHKYRVRDLAKRLGFERQTLYTAVNVLNTLGFAELKIKNLKLCGKILDSPAQRQKDKSASAPYPMQIATIHTEYLLPFLSASPPATRLKLFLLTAFYCDGSTGALNTEMRPVDWADLIGCHRRTAELQFDWMIERGFMHVTRDYVITGRHAGAAMGYWQLYLTSREQEKQTLQGKKNRKNGIKTHESVLSTLLKLFGIDARGWVSGHIEVAKHLLSEKILADGLAAFQRVKRELAEQPASA